METVISKSYGGAQTRLILPKEKDVAGVTGDNRSTRLRFKLPKPYATGWSKFIEFDCTVERDYSDVPDVTRSTEGPTEIYPCYPLESDDSFLVPYEIASQGGEIRYNLKFVSEDGTVVEKSELGTLYFRNSVDGDDTEPEEYVDIVTILANNAYCSVSYDDGTREGTSETVLPTLTFSPWMSGGESDSITLNVPYLDSNGHILNRFIDKEIVVEIFHVSSPNALTSLTQAQIPDMALIDQSASTETYYMDLYMLVGADPTVASNWYLVHTDNPTFGTVHATSADFNSTTTVGLAVTGDEAVSGNVAVTGQVTTAQVNTPKIAGTGTSPNAPLEITGATTVKNGLTVEVALATPSFTDNGSQVNFTNKITAPNVDISAKNVTVSTKTTTGTLESGAATFTGNIDASNKTVTASTFIGNVTGDVTGNATTATTAQDYANTGTIKTALEGKAPTNHASSDTTYGQGTSSQYGHVKVDSSMSVDSANPVQNSTIVNFVNSSIGTSTANFLGTYYAGSHDPVEANDLEIPQNDIDTKTEEQLNSLIITKLGTKIANPGNNDYVFVAINFSATVDVDEYRRFKYSAPPGQAVIGWLYEYTLNNSSFTQAQWDSINSLITNTTSNPHVGVDVKDINSHLGNSVIHVPTSSDTAGTKVLVNGGDGGQATWGALKTINSNSLIGSGDLQLVPLLTTSGIYAYIHNGGTQGQVAINGGAVVGTLPIRDGTDATITAGTPGANENSAKVATTSWVNTKLGNYVTLDTAQTITNLKTLNVTGTYDALHILNDRIVFKCSAIPNTSTVPESDIGGQYIAFSTAEAGNVRNLGTVGYSQKSGGTGLTYLMARRYSNTNSKYLRLYSGADGSGWVEAPYRAYADAESTDVLVKGHIANITDLVHTTGTESIAGVKTLTSGLVIDAINGFAINNDGAAGHYAITLNDSVLEKNVYPAADNYPFYIRIMDKNNVKISDPIGVHFKPNQVDGTIDLTAPRVDGAISADLTVCSGYTTSKWRTYNASNTGDVVTIGMLNTAMTINGNKTFTSVGYFQNSIRCAPASNIRRGVVILKSNSTAEQYFIGADTDTGSLLVRYGTSNGAEFTSTGIVRALNQPAYASTGNSDVLTKGHVPDLISANVGNGQISLTSSRGVAIDNFTVNQSAGKNIVLPAGSTQYTDQSMTFSLQSTPDFSDYPYMASKSITGLTADMYATVTFDDAQVSSGQYAPFCQTLAGEVRLYAKSNVGTITVPTISVGMDDSSAQQSMSNFVTLTGAQDISGTKTFYSTGFADVIIRSARTNQNLGGISFFDGNNLRRGQVYGSAGATSSSIILKTIVGSYEGKVAIETNGTNDWMTIQSVRAYNSNNTQDVVTIGSLQASTDVVHTTGNETIAGNKTFTNQPTFNQRLNRPGTDTSQFANLLCTDDDKTLTPTTTIAYPKIRFADKNDIFVGAIEFRHNTDGTYSIVGIVLNANGTQKQVELVRGNA